MSKISRFSSAGSHPPPVLFKKLHQIAFICGVAEQAVSKLEEIKNPIAPELELFEKQHDDQEHDRRANADEIEVRRCHAEDIAEQHVRKIAVAARG